MHPKNYREAYLAELQAAEAAPARRGARELVATIKDPAVAVPDRVTAAREAAQGDPLARPTLINALLTVLGDPETPAEVRLAALVTLQQTSVRMAEFQPHQAEFTEALRGAMDSADRPLRERAMDVLALDRDPVVQGLLERGLRDPEQAKIAPEKALRMLGYDVHAGHYDLLNDFVARNDQPKLRQVALGLLAADSNAKKTFARIAADPTDDPAARATSAVALQSLDPKSFNRVANKVVADDSDDDAVRATMLTALAHDQAAPPAPPVGGRGRRARPPAMLEVARNLSANKGSSAQLRAAARDYLDRHDG